MRFFSYLIAVVFVISVGMVPADSKVVAATAQNGLETDSARQLRIFKDALLHGASEQNRLDAAVELLVRPDKQSRAIVLEALISKDNPPARQAVCKGLIKSRALGAAMGNRNDFLEPLLAMLVNTDGTDAKLAAEAMLIFDYRQVDQKLKNLLGDSETDRQLRLNVVYAMKLRPEKEAMSELIGLLDDTDRTVAIAAEEALQESFGIPVGTDREVWKDILNDLKRKRPSDIIKKRLVSQQQQMIKLHAERNLWRSFYISALDKEYEIADETAKAVILAEKLGSKQPAVKIWALGKISKGSSGNVLPENFRAVLIGLISDDEKTVRLETAKVLSRMSGLNPARELLTQLKVEKYEDVMLAIFEALGEACYFAFLPGSEIKLPAMIRMQTLFWAQHYINQDDAVKAQKGAEVIRKLLELNGLEKVQTQKYLQLLAARYERANGKDGPLKAGLLHVMARLCGQASLKATASNLFEQAFVNGLGTEQNHAVREAAVLGLGNIDKANALRVFKDHRLAEDSSMIVREAVVKLVGEVGSEQDLTWLAQMKNPNGQSDLVWAAMLEILQRQKASVVASWADKLSADTANDQRVLILLEMAEKKAEGEKNDPVLSATQGRLWDIYLDANEYKKAVQFVARHLRDKDSDSNDVLMVKINTYLNSPQVNSDAKASLLQALGDMKNTPQRPLWKKQLESWRQKPTAETNQTLETNNTRTE